MRDNTDIVHTERFWYASFDFLVSVHTHARAFMHAGTRMHIRMHARMHIRMLCYTSDTESRCRLSDILVPPFTQVRTLSSFARINAQRRAEIGFLVHVHKHELMCVCIFFLMYVCM